jgi:hypothetical protein
VAAETVTFVIPPSVTATASQITSLHFYYSNYETEAPVAFEKQPDVKVAGGKFTLNVPVGSFITVSTRPGNKAELPKRAPYQPAFPLPYADDFQGCVSLFLRLPF